MATNVITMKAARSKTSRKPKTRRETHSASHSRPSESNPLIRQMSITESLAYWAQNYDSTDTDLVDQISDKIYALMSKPEFLKANVTHFASAMLCIIINFSDNRYELWPEKVCPQEQ